MKFEQSLHSLSKHIASCMRIDISFVPKIYQDLTLCTNEQIMQITEAVGDYYDVTTQSIVQFTNKLKKEEHIQKEEKDIEKTAEDEIIFFN